MELTSEEFTKVVLIRSKTDFVLKSLFKLSNFFNCKVLAGCVWTLEEALFVPVDMVNFLLVGCTEMVRFIDAASIFFFRLIHR